MVRNYLLIAFRSAWRNKAYTLINLFGLAIGMASSILIVLFVLDELSFDRHNEHVDHIYRICIRGRVQGTELEAALSNAPMGATLKSDFPQVLESTRLFTFDGDPVVRHEDRVFIEEEFYFVDSTFFQVFTAPPLSGDPRNMLNRPNTVVLTEETAKKYFGNEDPVGKLLFVGQGEREYEVTGVVKAFPENSHFHFSMLGSMTSIYLADVDRWLGNNNYTYIRLAPGSNAQDLEAEFPSLVARHIGPNLEDLLGMTLEEFKEAGNSYGYFLQALADIHLKSDLQFEITPGGSRSSVVVFSIIAVFILLIASINFMNLSTASASKRATEVGIRKVAGADKSKLVSQFLTESFLITFLALALAVVSVEFALPGFNGLTDKALSMKELSPVSLLGSLVFLGLFIGFLSGSYPAFFLSSFQPVQVLKSGAMRGMRGKGLRHILVTFQFMVTIVLFICTLVVIRQMDHLLDKDLGFQEENLLVIDRIHVLENQVDAFREELLRNPAILEASVSSTVPGGLFGDNVYLPEGAGSEQTHSINNMWADWFFMDCYQLELIEGRWFEEKRGADSLALVLNESAARAMGLEEALNTKIYVTFGEQSDVPRQVIGVVKDFHFQSLHQEVRPLIIEFASGNLFQMTVRINPDQSLKAREYVEKVWSSFEEQQAIHMSFLDEDLEALYQNDQKTASMFSIFSILAIVIACLGLLGLASFSAERRTKEVGIRKAMGASIPKVLYTLSREYYWLIFIASLLAWPLAYFAMRSWLENYPVRTELDPLIFLVSSLAALLIASITVLLRVYQSAVMNPASSLRYE